MTDVKTYRSYRGLPTLAGLATIEEAAKPGLSVEACVARLRRMLDLAADPDDTTTRPDPEESP